MNRNEEYQALLHELERTPEPLDGAVDRALARRKRARLRPLAVSAGSLAACFAAFVLLVNGSVPFARACGSVPLLRELALAVAWSPSLSAAVENEYVQPMGLSQTENGITATIEYVIVDQKQVNLFLTLEGDYETLSAEMPTFTPEQTCAVIGGGIGDPPGTLQQVVLDYGDGDVPEGFTMAFGVTGTVGEDETPRPAAAGGSILDPPEREEPEILAEFSFDLEFDPTFTAQGEVIPVDHTFQLGGQTLTVTTAEVYPTHVRVNVEGDPGNTAWLKGLEFCLENEQGERFETVSNGVSATGDPDSPAVVSFRLESPYFADSEHLTLRVTGATWLDKDRESLHVDLANLTADWLPEGVELYSAGRSGSGWYVQFSAPERRERSFYQLFSMTYDGPEGEEHDMAHRSTMTEPYFEGPISSEDADAAREAGEGRFFEILPLENYPYDEVWLRPTFSHRTEGEAVIPIK